MNCTREIKGEVIQVAQEEPTLSFVSLGNAAMMSQSVRSTGCNNDYVSKFSLIQ